MRKADNLPPSGAVVMKSRNLNFLEPSGPLQACDGTALLFTMACNYHARVQLIVILLYIASYGSEQLTKEEKQRRSLSARLHT